MTETNQDSMEISMDRLLQTNEVRTQVHAGSLVASTSPAKHVPATDLVRTMSYADLLILGLVLVCGHFILHRIEILEDHIRTLKAKQILPSD